MYGKTVNSEGKSLENDFTPVETGLHVKGNVIKSIEIFKDEEGVEDLRRAILTVEQSNGGELRHTVWDGLKNGEVEDKAVDRLNGFMLHLGTVISETSPEEYSSLIGSPASFKEFIETFNTKIIPKANGKSFTMTVIKRENQSNGKWYAQIPIFPNFIELDGTEPSTIFMKKSYIFETPEVSSPSAGTSSDVEDAF